MIRKPWLAYDFSRRTYFRRKAAETLPPLPVQIGANVPSLPEKIGGTGWVYIMTRARVALLISLCQLVLARVSAHKSRGYQGVQELFIPLFLNSVRKWVRIKSLMCFKRRRKSKRKRKRKRG